MALYVPENPRKRCVLAATVEPNVTPLFHSILVTGASSGVGAEIAKALSLQGVTLVLGGRDAARLQAVAEVCEQRGARVIHWLADLDDLSPALATLADFDRTHSFDLAVLNAGIGDSGSNLERPEVTARLADINFRAPAAMASLLAARMEARKQGSICFVGSTAAWTPLPMAPGYAASKAAIAMFARALDAAVRPQNVAVTLATPGFIDTPMSRRLDCPQPFLMRADRAANVMLKAIAARKREVVFPWQFRILRALLAIAPANAVRFFLSRLPFSARPYDPHK